MGVHDYEGLGFWILIVFYFFAILMGSYSIIIPMALWLQDSCVLFGFSVCS